jgi:hypothetical protein
MSVVIADVADSNILLIADGISKGISEKEIIEAYIIVGFGMADITLLLAAAKLLCTDRKNVQPTKKLFKRVV